MNVSLTSKLREPSNPALLGERERQNWVATLGRASPTPFSWFLPFSCLKEVRPVSDTC